MKNKKNVIITLSIVIIVLLSTAAIYAFMNRDSFIARANKEPEVEIKNVAKGNELKTVATYLELKELLQRDEITFLVLGRTGCHHCTNYKPVLEETSKNYGIEIIYVDLAQFSKEDYSSVMNSSLTIPGKCTDSGKEIELNKGFGTPLSLFVKNEKTVDCIRGYKDSETLSNLLIKNGYVEEA